jgi:hypothetical protein
MTMVMLKDAIYNLDRDNKTFWEKKTVAKSHRKAKCEIVANMCKKKNQNSLHRP